ncbi:hypothetical protein BDW75DRAFT_225877 [Aspergillus navahoensis]
MSMSFVACRFTLTQEPRSDRFSQLDGALRDRENGSGHCESGIGDHVGEFLQIFGGDTVRNCICSIIGVALFALLFALGRGRNSSREGWRLITTFVR